MFRYSLLVCAGAMALSLSDARAQTPAEPPVAAPLPPSSILSVSLPPNARLRLDLDARDEDVLGVVKSLLRGFNGSILNNVLNPRRDSIAKSAPAADAASELNAAATLAMLSDADLATMLKDVRHLRVVVFETPRTFGRPKPGAVSVLSHYQGAYIEREGGRRFLRVDFDDEMQSIGVSFRGRGFAWVLQAPGLGMVVRADGYPNFESVGPVATAMFLRFSQNARF